ncbi:flagellar protein FliT [mine drainage metagenome]|uniref:Flagellar protein FliT n=1 Tax=mine drainage metagenome TaxID=410659 RepID=A0A1J5Q2R1_9ZZZZ
MAGNLSKAKDQRIFSRSNSRKSVMSQILIDYYKAIENSSAKMLDAARAEDWEGVMRYEGACAVLIEQLRCRAKTEALDASTRQEKTRIMQRILCNDAQIRYLAEPWLDHFESKFEGQQLLH